MKRPIRMIDVARACGVNHSTVSRALRNHPSIPPATRERVARAAEKLGFRPDPKLSLLMAQVRHGRQAEIQSTLALVYLHEARPGGMKDHFRGYISGVKKRAEDLGYGLDEFFLDEGGIRGSDLKRIFHARRIDGAVLIGGSHSAIETGIDWPIAAWATVGFFCETPALHAAAADYASHAMMCFDALWKMGRRRIAFVQGKAADERIGHLWLAGFCAMAFRSGCEPMIYTVPDADWEGFGRWIEEAKPDGIVTHAYHALLLAAEHGSKADVALVNLGISHEPGERLGVIENAYAAGVSAVDLVVGQLLRGERGVPEFQKRVLVRGRWFAEKAAADSAAALPSRRARKR